MPFSDDLNLLKLDCRFLYTHALHSKTTSLLCMKTTKGIRNVYGVCTWWCAEVRNKRGTLARIWLNMSLYLYRGCTMEPLLAWARALVCSRPKVACWWVPGMCRACIFMRAGTLTYRVCVCFFVFVCVWCVIATYLHMIRNTKQRQFLLWDLTWLSYSAIRERHAESRSSQPLIAYL